MTIRFPYVTASLRAAGVTAGLTPERVLFVGQKLAAGTALSGALQENILSDKSEDTLFGSASPLASAIRRARLRNGVTQFDAIGLSDNGSGVAATSTFTIAGSPTVAGTITFYVGSRKYNIYKAEVAISATPTVMATAVVAAVTADANAFVTAANVAGVVTFTAKTKGTFGNTLGVKFDTLPAGVTATLTAFASGATDPVLTGVFDVIGEQRYQGIVWQFDNSLSTLYDFLDARFNVTNNVLDGVGIASKTDTFSNHLVTLAPLNSKNLTLIVDKKLSDADFKGGGVLEVPFVKAAEFGAIRALKHTDGVVLGDLVIARSSLDSFGGIWQNSKPYANTPFAGLITPDVGDSFTDTEIGQLKAAGGWVIDANRARTATIAGEVVTTYKTDSAGNPDPTFGFLNYRDTSTAAREYIVNNTRTKYPQYRAMGGALVAGIDGANEASIAAFVAEKYQELGDLGLVNTGTGTVNGVDVDYDKLFRQGLTVSLNTVTGKFLVSFNLYIIVQLRAVTYDIAVAFEV